jgi:hypothetical protein
MLTIYSQTRTISDQHPRIAHIRYLAIWGDIGGLSTASESGERLQAAR